MAFINPGSVEEIKKQTADITRELERQAALQEKLTGMGGRAGSGSGPGYVSSVSRDRDSFRQMYKDEKSREESAFKAGSIREGLHGLVSLRRLMSGGEISARDISHVTSVSSTIAKALGFENVSGALGAFGSAVSMAAPAAMATKEYIDAARNSQDERRQGYSEFLKTSSATKNYGELLEIHRLRGDLSQTAAGGRSAWSTLAENLPYFASAEDTERGGVEKDLQRHLDLAHKGISFKTQREKYAPANFMDSAAAQHASSFQDRGTLDYVLDAMISNKMERFNRDMAAATKESLRVMEGQIARSEHDRQVWEEQSYDGVLNGVLEKQRNEYLEAVKKENIKRVCEWTGY